MPIFTITVKHNVNTNGVVLQKGMSVEIPSNNNSNPLTINGGQEVQEAFLQIHKIDLKKAGALNSGYLEVK